MTSKIIVIVAIVALGVIVTALLSTGAPDTVAAPVVVQAKPDTHRGRTAKGWYERAQFWLHRKLALEKKLGDRIRQVRSLKDALRTDLSPVGTHWLERAFTCIHNHEGRWNDAGAPYWGGLQMDESFQRSYGAEFLRYFGTADHWPISVQYAVAIRAYIARGFGPWPTRRYCGL